jgi:predicted phage terminase large subunit-like protein
MAMAPDLANLSTEALRVELARRGIIDFTTYTFPGYRTNWHHKVWGDALDDFLDGDTDRLMIFSPPRHGKSELVSRRLPAYFMGKNPRSEVILASYAADLANRMNSNVQLIMDSPEYRRIFPHVRLPGGDRGPNRRGQQMGRRIRTQEYFELAGHPGSLRSAGVGGGITGMGFHLGIIDDPIKDSEEGMSQVIRDKVWDWYQSTFYTRQMGLGEGKKRKKAKILLTMTRWHEDDLAGRLLRLARTEPGADQWKVVTLPALSLEERAPYDQRTGPGQALWEDSPYNAEWLNRTRRNLPNFFWQALYQQRPITEGAGYFQRKWFTEAPRFEFEGEWVRIPGWVPFSIRDCLVVGAVDLAASEKQKADYTVVIVLAITPTGHGLILDVIRDRTTPNGIPGLMALAANRWPVRYFVLEADGFQGAVATIARRDYSLPPIREVKHNGKGKVVRATQAMVYAEQGRLHLPVRRGAEPAWEDAFLEELEVFTGEDDRHDDQVDALGYGCDEFGRFGSIEWVDVAKGSVRPGAEPARGSAAVRRGLWGLGR